MATHNAAPRRSDISNLVNYVLRNGDGNKYKHEHDINLIEFLGGNTFCSDPLDRDFETGLVINVDPSDIIDEFEEQAAIHQGKGEKVYGHYMINLAPEDRELSHSEWLEMATKYMKTQGFDETTKWIAVRHDDCDHSHIHVVACLVMDKVELKKVRTRNGEMMTKAMRGPLVSTQESALKGFPVMRHFEKKFDLRELESPDDSFGHHYTKGEIKGHGGLEEAKNADKATVIRARFKDLRTEGNGKLPNTMMGLVTALNKKGIEVKVSQKSDGSIKGISYRADGDTWISGSKIAKTMTTFNALQKKMGVNYNPHRDNAFLGLPVTNRDCIDVSIKITETQYKRILVNKPKIRVRQRTGRGFSVDLSFLPAKNRDMAKLIQVVMELMQDLFSCAEEIFDVDYVDRYVYESVEVKQYEMNNIDFTRAELDFDTQWRNESDDFLNSDLGPGLSGYDTEFPFAA